ncbi:hypothetical protein Scep_020332 [Stephania cephalantha]|uniref:CTLH domain-containing protein n=1 Tax=Stephania cephalantha TaxID=152367 RepID=A0AAP0ICI7_9MAGN
MESTVVNWEALDALVLDFSKSDHLIIASPPSSSISDSTPSSSSSSSSISVSDNSNLSSSSYHSRSIIRTIRRSLETGDVDAALGLLRLHAPFVLQDHRFLFRLQKQRFIELLRRGTEEDRSSAIECLRNSLAPCALDAYPEAYEEFKHVLLALIFDKNDHTSPVANEWSERRRFDIAGLLSSVLRAHFQAYDPVFSMTLRYLISIHKGFCLRQGIPSPISDLTERLLLEDRDFPPVPQESLYEVPPFDEVDIQALAHAVELTRQGAVDSLRFAKGDLFQAFQNELCRMKLDISLLDELVHEYCVYRGIVEASGMQGPAQSLKMCHSDPGCSSMKNCSAISMDYEAVKHPEGETSIISADVASQGMKAEGTSVQCTDVELRFAHESNSTHEDCSTSDARHFENSRWFQRSRRDGTSEKRRRMRWRGRIENVEDTPDVPFTSSSIPNLNIPVLPTETHSSAEQQVLQKQSSTDIACNKEDLKYEFVLEMKELVSRGMAAEVVEEVNSVDPDFFVQNGVLLFQIKQIEFLKLANSGDHSGALRVASTYLGPLAASNPTLLKPLKETLVTLLRSNEDALANTTPLTILATSFQVAMGRRLGIDEPQLMKLMRAAIYTHAEWCKLHRCKDHFEGLLKIDCLKEIGAPLIIDERAKTNVDTPGSSQVTISSSSRMQEDGSPAQASSGEPVYDETAILKVMEFLALPRADAIHLLAQYNGNAETVIQQIFA